MDDAEGEFSECWIDVLGFTKKDWQEIEIIAANLKGDGYFNGSDFKCIVAAAALFVSDGRGVRESTQ